MKKILFIILGFALGLGPLWLTLATDPPSSESAEKDEPKREISSTPSAPKSSSGSQPKTKESLRKEIEATNKCYESQSCDFPQTDPRSYNIAVGRKIAEQLRFYRMNYASDPSSYAEATELAETYVKSDDGYVQEEALHILSQLPPSRERLDAIFTGIEYSPDPLIIEQAMNEMKRYIGTSEEDRVQAFLTELLAHGAQYSSEKASSLILTFINERSYDIFKNALASMPPQTIAAEQLRTALEEYRRQVSGG